MYIHVSVYIHVRVCTCIHVRVHLYIHVRAGFLLGGGGAFAPPPLQTDCPPLESGNLLVFLTMWAYWHAIK